METDENNVYLESDGQYSMIKRERDPEIPLFINKSNMLIHRYGSVDMLSEEILLVALATAKKHRREDIQGTVLEKRYQDINEKIHLDLSEGLISTFTNKELKKLLNIKSSEYYTKLDDLMNNDVFAGTWNLVYKEGNTIARKFIVDGTKYDSDTGRIYIKWKPEIEDKITDLKENYTRLDPLIMRKLRDINSWSLYQILRSEIGKQEGIRKKNGVAFKDEYEITYNLSELKFLTMAIKVDTASKSDDEKACRNLISQGDFDSAEEVLSKEKRAYSEWRDFKRRILEKASKKINGFKKADYNENDEEYLSQCAQNSPTDIHFRYVPRYKNRSVSEISFYVSWTRSYGKNILPATETIDAIDVEAIDIDEILEDIEELIEEHVSLKDLRNIAKTANYHMERIEKAYEYVRTIVQDYEEDHLVEYLLAAISKGYTLDGMDETVEEVPKKTEKPKKAPVKKKPDMTQDFLNKLIKLFADCENLSVKDMINIAEAAENDYDKIEKAYKIAMEKPRTNFVGFMVKAIKDDYALPIATKGKPKVPQFDYKQREYTEEQLKEQTRRLLRRSLINKD